ncbi:hypothetical protein Tco_0264652 [Tanacetum coccineum]
MNIPTSSEVDDACSEHVIQGLNVPDHGWCNSFRKSLTVERHMQSLPVSITMPTITDPMMTAPAEAIVAAETKMKTFKDVVEGLKVIGTGTTTIALAGAAVGIGKIFSSLIRSVARSPFATVSSLPPKVGIHLSTCLPLDLRAFSGTAMVYDLAGADLHPLSFFEPFGTKSPLTTNQQTSSGWVLPVICSHTMLLQSDLAGERSQFATENKTTSERTFVRFFSTKHGSLRITVGRWLPKETPIRSAPRLGGIYLIPITWRGSL